MVGLGLSGMAPAADNARMIVAVKPGMAAQVKAAVLAASFSPRLYICNVELSLFWKQFQLGWRKIISPILTMTSDRFTIL